jgi:hypothetical protein
MSETAYLATRKQHSPSTFVGCDGPDDEAATCASDDVASADSDV